LGGLAARSNLATFPSGYQGSPGKLNLKYRFLLTIPKTLPTIFLKPLLTSARKGHEKEIENV
jgi:hypothetical protein